MEFLNDSYLSHSGVFSVFSLLYKLLRKHISEKEVKPQASAFYTFGYFICAGKVRTQAVVYYPSMPHKLYFSNRLQMTSSNF